MKNRLINKLSIKDTGVDLGYYHKKYLVSEENNFLICALCDGREKQNDCFILLEYIKIPVNGGVSYHTRYTGGFPYICGPMREISDADRYLDLLENCCGKLT